jgi:hypothetical protein
MPASRVRSVVDFVTMFDGQKYKPEAPASGSDEGLMARTPWRFGLVFCGFETLKRLALSADRHGLSNVFWREPCRLKGPRNE